MLRASRPSSIGMEPSPQTLRLLLVMVSVLLVAAGHYAGGIVGTLLGFPSFGIAVIWPSTAILIAVLLLAQPRHWWVFLLAVVPVHRHLAAIFQRPEPPFVVMLCQVGGNAFQAVLTAVAVRASSSLVKRHWRAARSADQSLSDETGRNTNPSKHARNHERDPTHPDGDSCPADCHRPAGQCSQKLQDCNDGEDRAGKTRIGNQIQKQLP
jgi:hypothetical protein